MSRGKTHSLGVDQASSFWQKDDAWLIVLGPSANCIADALAILKRFEKAAKDDGQRAQRHDVAPPRRRSDQS